MLQYPTLSVALVRATLELNVREDSEDSRSSLSHQTHPGLQIFKVSNAYQYDNNNRDDIRDEQ